MPRNPRLRSLLTGPAAVAVLLAVFWVTMVASLREKSLTSDEPVHLTAGYSYWRFNDYRIDPENGNLPQRWMAVPLLFGAYRFPSLDFESWQPTSEWDISDRWLYHQGNDALAIALKCRAMAGLLAVALGALVWAWSRRLFGPSGGMLSLLLFVLDPTILANGALLTSDTACALFFLASVGGIWSALGRISPVRVVLSGLLVGGLFVSKMSAMLIVPIGLVLGLVRIFSGPAPVLEWRGVRALVSRRSRALAFAAIAAIHVALVLAVIWGFFGFRYRTPGRDYDESPFRNSWAQVLGPSPAAGAPDIRPLSARVLDDLRERQLLPESYLFGAAHAFMHARARSAFLNGQESLTGWRWFFPYTVLVKTPIPIFFVVALTCFALRRRRAYGMIPLGILFGFYWAAAIASNLNIGHRHVMATFPPLCILCGAAGMWWESIPRSSVAGGRARAAGWALSALMAALAVETAVQFPNYLAYFNVIGGGMRDGYRHLVDSSLDWGQDLPAVKGYIEGHRREGPFYFSYFGTASPDYYRVPAKYLYSFGGQDVPPPVQLLDIRADRAQAYLTDLLGRHPEYEISGGARGPNGRLGVMLIQNPQALRLSAGTYLISASMLQPVMYRAIGPMGPWNERFERTYRRLAADAQPLLSDNRSEQAVRARSPTDWWKTMTYYDMYRFGRLTAYLRRLEPIDNIDGSVLVYRLTDDDLARALEGPPPELGMDLPTAAGEAEDPP